MSILLESGPDGPIDLTDTDPLEGVPDEALIEEDDEMDEDLDEEEDEDEEEESDEEEDGDDQGEDE